MNRLRELKRRDAGESTKLEMSGRGTPGRDTPAVRRFVPPTPPWLPRNGRSDMTTHHNALSAGEWGG